APATPLRFRVERPAPRARHPARLAGTLSRRPRFGRVHRIRTGSGSIRSFTQSKAISFNGKSNSLRKRMRRRTREVPWSHDSPEAVFGHGAIAPSATSGLDLVRCQPVAGGEETGDFDAREQRAMEALRPALIAR